MIIWDKIVLYITIDYREQSFVLDKDVHYQVSSVMRKSAFYTPRKTEF